MEQDLRQPEQTLFIKCMYLAEWEPTSAFHNKKAADYRYDSRTPLGLMRVRYTALQNKKGEQQSEGRIRVLLGNVVVLDALETKLSFDTNIYLPQFNGFDWENYVHELFDESDAVATTVVHRR